MTRVVFPLKTEEEREKRRSYTYIGAASLFTILFVVLLIGGFRIIFSTTETPVMSPVPQPATARVLGEDDKQALQKEIARSLTKLEGKVAFLEEQLTYHAPYTPSSSVSFTGQNLIRNSSFESAEGGKPRQWTYMYDSTTGNTRQSKEGIRSGAYGLKFKGATSTGSGLDLGVSQPETETVPGRTYTLSFYLKHTNIKGEAYIRLGFWDRYNNQFGPMKVIPVTGTKDWSRVSTTVTTTGLITDHANWYPMIEVRRLKDGEAVYLDDVQLEEGSVLTLYNSAIAAGISNSFTSGFGDGSILATPNGHFYPALDGVGTLGTPTNRWNALYLSKATINENGDLSLDGTAAVGSDLRVSGRSTFDGSVTLQGETVLENDLLVEGTTTLSGDVTLGDTASDTITVNGTPTFINLSSFAGGITVGENGEFSLGAAGNITKIHGVAYSFPNTQGAANDVLINDGAGNLSWGSLGAATVDPDSLDFSHFKDAMAVDANTSVNLFSGSARTLRFFNSNTASDLLFLDGTTGRVGIGTQTPNAKLDVSGSIFPTITLTHDLGSPTYEWNNLYLGGTLDLGTNTVTDGIFSGNWGFSSGNLSNIGTISSGAITVTGASSFADLATSGTLTLSDGTATTPALSFINDPDSGLYRLGENKIGLITGGSDSQGIIVDGSGNVGMGTTTPGYKLDIAGSLNFTGTLSAGGSSGTLGQLLVSQGISTPVWQDIDAAIGDSAFLQGGNTFGAAGVIGTSDNYALYFITNGSDQMVITATGRVGIGTTNPGATLEVAGTIVGSTLSDGTVTITNGNITGAGTVTASSYSGSGASLTNLNATNLASGTVPDARISGTYTSAITLSNALNSFTGIGTGLTALNASNLASGTVPSGRLSGSYTIDVSGNATTATTLQTARTIAIGTGATGTATSFDGSGNITIPITAIDADYITTGTVNSARIAGSYTGITGLGTIATGIWQGSVIDAAYLDDAVILSTEIDTYAELNALVSDVTLTHNGLIDTSAKIAGIVSDGTGSGALVFATSPQLTTPDIGAATGTSLNVTGAITAGGIVTGTGSGLTNLNASNLSSGTVPSGRLSGTYTIDVSGNATTATTLQTARTIAIGTGATGTATSFDGSTNITIPITAIDADYITTGTVNTARISGSYTGITGVGALNAGSITSGFGDINIGSSIFTGNGSGITTLNADNISSGTLNASRLAGTYTIDVAGNASTATALQTARTLWGQSFDGTGNVSGSLTSVGDITGSGAITLAAGGTNQNIRLTPSGTGYTLLDGNVGVGTTSPSYLLDVNGTARIASTLTMGGNIILNGRYLSGDGGNEGVYVDSSGNVAIGQSSASYTLDVLSTIRAKTSLNAGDSDVLQGNVNIFGPASGQTIGGELHIHTAADYDSTINRYTMTTFQDDLWLGRFIGTYYGDIVITDTGNVGIGNTTPVSKLDVAGTGWIRGGTGNTTGLFVDASGNVGVGTTVPGYKLQIIADNINETDIRIRNQIEIGSGGRDSFMTATDTVSIYRTTTGWTETPVATGNLMLQSRPDAGRGIGFVTGGTPALRMFIDDGGNVGIGTTAPSSMLHVEKSQTSETGIKVLNPNSDPSAKALLRVGYNDNAGMDIYRSGNSADIFFNATQGTGKVRFQDAGSDTLAIDSVGNVGIGTTAPGAKLHIGSLVGVETSGIKLSGSNNDRIEFIQTDFSNGAGSRIGIFDHNWGDPQFKIDLRHDSASWTNILSITRGWPGKFTIMESNVGIGTTNPGYRLQVGMAGDGSEARANAWNTLSDQNLKEKIKVIGSPLDVIEKLQGVKFNWKATGEESMGFIAQDLEKVLPQVVSTGADGYKSVNYPIMNALLVEGMKELNKKIDANIRIDEFGNTVQKTLPPASIDHLDTVALNQELETLKDRIDGIERRLGPAPVTEDNVERVVYEEQMASVSAALATLKDDVELLKATQFTASVSAFLDGTNLPVVDDETTLPNLVVTGHTNVYDLAVTGKMTAGLLAIDGLSCTDAGNCAASISTFSGPLRLQEMASGVVEMMAGKVVIDTTGDMKVEGTLTVGEVVAEKVTAETVKTSVLELEDDVVFTSGATAPTGTCQTGAVYVWNDKTKDEARMYVCTKKSWQELDPQ